MNSDLPKQWLISLKSRAVALSPQEFPNISLTIPETIHPVVAFLTGRMFLFNFMVGFLLMAMVIVGKDIGTNTARLHAAETQRQIVVDSLHHWERVVRAFSNIIIRTSYTIRITCTLHKD